MGWARSCRIPRGLPRGLIEAPAPTAPAPLPLRFRGDFPAASLKQIQRSERALSRRPIPRGLPRGLIEARQFFIAIIIGFGGFRGDFPAASLKRLGAYGAVLGVGGFRGDFPRPH